MPAAQLRVVESGVDFIEHMPAAHLFAAPFAKPTRQRATCSRGATQIRRNSSVRNAQVAVGTQIGNSRHGQTELQREKRPGGTAVVVVVIVIIISSSSIIIITITTMIRIIVVDVTISDGAKCIAASHGAPPIAKPIGPGGAALRSSVRGLDFDGVGRVRQTTQGALYIIIVVT